MSTKYMLVQTERGPRVLWPDGTMHLPAIAGADDPSPEMKALEHLKTTWEATNVEIKNLVAQQGEEIKKFGETSEATATALKAVETKYDEQAAMIKSVEENIQKRMDEIEAEGKRLLYGPSGEKQVAPGTAFVNSDAYKNWVSEGNFSAKSAPYAMKTLVQTTTLGTRDVTLGSVVRVPGIIQAPIRIERVRDLLPVIPTQSPAIEYIRETGFTNAAAPVAEGNNKPESALSFTLEATNARTIAHWLPATRQILADAPQLEAYINQRLLTGLELVEDEQLLYGDGTGQNLLGILNDPDISTYDGEGVLDNNGDAINKIDTIRRGFLVARLAEYPITGVVLHPTDWADIELLKGSDGHYIWLNIPNGNSDSPMFRVPVVETTAIEQGTALAGAFALAAAIYDREDADIRVSDSHGNTFIQNIMTILAEERIALAIYRPEAFVKIDLEDVS